jgi:hypothetical protein
MDKKSENLIFFLLVIFSIYCSLAMGMSWDEPYLYELGKNRLKYLFSLGKYKYQNPIYFANASYFPGFYDTLTAFISQMIPRKYEVQIHHIINLFFSISAVIGISKISKILFNKKVSKIVFLITFLNPIFFGHMSINPKDTIITFSNIWVTYFIIRYLQTQHIEIKRKYFSTLIGITIGLGLGVRANFIGTLIPIFIIFFLDTFYFRIINKKKKLSKFFFKDFIKISFISYFIMIIFWPEVHQNIFILPFKLVIASLTDVSYGTSWGLLDGIFYKTINTPREYLIINLFYKLPEYVLLTYLFFIFLLFNDNKFFRKHFKFFSKKILYLLIIILFPLIIAFIVGLKIHDGLRYFLFIIPYLSIIPGFAIYYLIYNRDFLLSKIFTFLISISFIYFLFIFFSLTPYHYTYLNRFNGNFPDASKRFENDYWGLSIKELVYKIEKNKIFKKNKNYKIAFCGINYDIGSYYLKKIDDLTFIKTYKDKIYDYIIMTNRHNGKDDDKKAKVKTCFDTYKGKDILSVKRNGLILSTIRKK